VPGVVIVSLPPLPKTPTWCRLPVGLISGPTEATVSLSAPLPPSTVMALLTLAGEQETEVDVAATQPVPAVIPAESVTE
jgi:hypothetical protein